MTDSRFCARLTWAYGVRIEREGGEADVVR